MGRGERVACISDAGTPAVSDPGAALVAAVRDVGHRIVPVPGASSALAALTVAGDVSRGGFSFIGFLPSRGKERSADAMGRRLPLPARSRNRLARPLLRPRHDLRRKHLHSRHDAERCDHTDSSRTSVYLH